MRHEQTPAVEFTQQAARTHGIREFRLPRNLSCQLEFMIEFCLDAMLIRTLLRSMTLFLPMTRLRACLNLTGLDVVDPGCITWFGRELATKMDFFLVRQCACAS